MSPTCLFCNGIANNNNFVYKNQHMCDNCYKTRCFYCTQHYDTMNDVKLLSYYCDFSYHYFFYNEDEYKIAIKNNRGCSCSKPYCTLCSSLSKICDFCKYIKSEHMEYKLYEDGIEIDIDYFKSNITDLQRNLFDELPTQSDNITETFNHNFDIVNDYACTINSNFDNLNNDIYEYKENVHRILNTIVNDFYNYKLTMNQTIRQLQTEIDSLKKV